MKRGGAPVFENKNHSAEHKYASREERERDSSDSFRGNNEFNRSFPKAETFVCDINIQKREGESKRGTHSRLQSRAERLFENF